MNTPLYIFDLDGTLADLKHRRHHVEGTKKNWDAFHAECVNDTPIVPVVALFHALLFGAQADVWIWSGRNSSVRAQTEAWITKHVTGAVYVLDNLKMRSANDRRMDEIIKEEWLHAMSAEDRARLVMIFEDRQRVVDMWRRNGIVCAQVAPGDF